VTFMLVLLLGSTGTAWAGGAETHDGFAARLAIGGGYAASSESIGGTSMKITGGSVLMSFAFGYAVIENLIVNVDLFGAGTMSPKVSAGGSSMSPDDASLTNAGFGGGVTYYVMPVNLYVAASVGMARSMLEVSGMEFRTGTGFGVNAMLGKEWWISENWGLGVAGQFLYMRVPDGDYTLGTLGGGVLFSATYN